MSTAAEEVDVDIAALDAAAAAKKAETAAKTANAEPKVVVDPEITAQKTGGETLTPEQGIEKLQRQLEAEKTARQAADAARAAAESRAQEAAKAEAEARGRVQTTELDLVKNSIASLTQANDALESKYAEAMAAQDWPTAAKLQRQMGNNSAKLAHLEIGKTRLENQPKPTPRAPTDPVEAFCAQLSAPSAAWVRAHPDFARDPHKSRQMIAAHELAIARGYKADTDDYFKSIEKTLDLTPVAAAPANGNGTHVDDDDDPLAGSAAVAAGGRQSAPAAAPVSRSPTGANGSRPGVVRLTAQEVEIAENMGMTVEEYARHKVALKKEGKLS